MTETNVSFIDDGTEWETVSQASGEPIELVKPGDSFTGIYEGAEVITFDDPKEGTKSFNQYKFRGADGKLYSLNGSYGLDNPDDGIAAKVAIGAKTRITLAALVPTGQPSPMKDFQIDVAKTKEAETKK